jgi:O-succinylbenzoate synthase
MAHKSTVRHPIFVSMFTASIHERDLKFSFDARTSRGAIKSKRSWYLSLIDQKQPNRVGYGECGPLPGLSPEFEQVPAEMEKAAQWVEQQDPADVLTAEAVMRLLAGSTWSSSVRLALEMALLDWLNGGQRLVFHSPFATGDPVPINGLIWMGGVDFMLQQVEIKIRDGFTCVKLKVGGNDFEKECDVLQYIRRKYYKQDIIIRLDANGAFKPEDAPYKLKELSRYGIHSIEQPLKKGSPALAELCAQSPIPIALDEELIGVSREQKASLLDQLKPAYLVLKPSLHGGFAGCREWIALAGQLGMGWWITSALESNVGLNAIAQFASQYPLTLPQGLGTGAIYENNIPSPLLAEKGYLTKRGWDEWDLSVIANVPAADS